MKQILLGSRTGAIKFALVDDGDYAWLSQFPWHLEKSKLKNALGYARATIRPDGPGTNPSHLSMHRLILGLQDQVTGLSLSSVMGDHRDGDTLNNQRYNLRPATNSQNQANANRTLGTSPYKGVSFHKPSGSWKSQIRVNSHLIYLGLHEKELDAARAYDVKSKEFFGEFALLNFPIGTEKEWNK